ncbi:Ig-like domain-containing protein [Mycolicibacterium agri]|nr:Ig-like domain-containing protein [Mycolicibacterium agri]
MATPSEGNTGDAPLGTGAAVMQALQLARRDMDLALVNEASVAAPRTVAPRSLVISPVKTMLPAATAATAAAVPQPGDVASTVYGDIGKWMLKSGGQVANWGGQLNNGQPIYEPVNVIIIDDASTSREESITKLNRAMKVAGFPARTPHSGGYKAIIDGATYGQQPTGFLQAFASSGTPTDHGRMFGPADSSAGYVWSGAFSTQNGSHRYVSFVTARDDLADQLVARGVATSLAPVDLGNAGITGDHDGYAVVLVLNPGMPNTQPTAALKQSDPSRWSGMVTGQVTASDADGDRLTFVTSEPTKGTVTLTSRGMFRYTPTAAARHAAAADDVEQPVVDQFSITVSDGFGGVADVPVSVVVLPKNTVPTSWARVNRPDASGNVAGSITVRDADGDQVVYRHTEPSSGSVTINSDGTFTYVPTESARQQAKLTPGSDFDTFTITVDDGHGGLRTMTVRATIAPAD